MAARKSSSDPMSLMATWGVVEAVEEKVVSVDVEWGAQVVDGGVLWCGSG